MKKFYINDKEVETVEEFLESFIKTMSDYAEYATNILEIKLNLISEILSNLALMVADGGEYWFHGIDYKVEQIYSDE